VEGRLGVEETGSREVGGRREGGWKHEEDMTS